jgi:hypothetical protein
VIVLAQSVGQLQDTLVAVQRFLPRLLAFVIVLVVGYVVARLLARAVATMLARTGFDDAAQRGGVRQVLARSGYDAGALLSRVVFFGLLLLVLQLAFAVFGPNPISASLAGIIAFLPRLFVAMVIVVLAAAIATGARELVIAQIGELSYGGLLGGCAYALILGIGVFAALDQLQIAPAIVNGLFYGLITIIAGVTIVAVGGGGIAPMRQRWEQALARMDTEAVRMRESVQTQREQRAAAEREERERQERLAREEQQRQQEEQERQAAQQRAEAEREEREQREREQREQEVHARRAREEQERRTTREFEALAQRGVYTEEQLRAARELAEFEQEHASSGAGDGFNGERRRSTSEASQSGFDGFQHRDSTEDPEMREDGFTGDQRQAAWELEAFRQEQLAIEQQRQARERDAARTQDFDYFQDVEHRPPEYRPAATDDDAAASQPGGGAGLDYRRRLRASRRLPSDQERPPIRYRGPGSERETERYDTPAEPTPWDAPDS